MINEKTMERTRQDIMVQIEGFAPGKTIILTPYNIVMMRWFIDKYGYEGDLSDFINDTIEDFFKSRNWSIKIIEEKILP